MNIKIASWNVEGRLSKITPKTRGNPSQIIETIRKINADIVILLEAHLESSIDKLKSKQHLINMGYSVFSVPYKDDTSSRADSNTKYISLMLLSKLFVKEFKIIRLGNFRNAIEATLITNDDKQFKIIGIHLDDRSENLRIKQIIDISTIINKTTVPTVVMGDFNAMHGEDLWPAKLLQSKYIKLFAKHIKSNIFIRATEMARGEAIRLLETNTSLIDIDKSHRPTTTPKMLGHEWLPSIKLIQIDHIFISRNIKTNNFKVSPDGGSDHRAISAEIII